MAYKETVKEQEEFGIDVLEKRLDFLETHITDDVAKCLQGKNIYLLYPELYNANHFVNTTVSDVLDVCDNEFNVWWMNDCSMYKNLSLYNLRLANPKECRGILKYTPKNTLMFEQYSVGKMKKTDSSEVLASIVKEPLIQREIWLKDSCELYFNTDEANADWDFIERNAFIPLAYDNRFSCKKNERSFNYKNAVEETSQICHAMICTYFDISNSWAITYLYKGILFLIPIKLEFFKTLFKDRDKGENGRRNFVPSIINSHERKNGQNVHSHLRTGGTYLSIHGREFSYLIGAEDFEKMFPKTDYNRKKLLKLRNESFMEEKFYALGIEEKQF